MLENNIYLRAHMLIMSTCALGCGWYIFQSSHDIVVVRPHRQRIERITNLAGSQQGGPWPSQPACYQVNPINQSALKLGKRQDERACKNNFFLGEKVLSFLPGGGGVHLWEQPHKSVWAETWQRDKMRGSGFFLRVYFKFHLHRSLLSVRLSAAG